MAELFLEKGTRENGKSNGFNLSESLCGIGDALGQGADFAERNSDRPDPVPSSRRSKS